MKQDHFLLKSPPDVTWPCLSPTCSTLSTSSSQTQGDMGDQLRLEKKLDTSFTIFSPTNLSCSILSSSSSCQPGTTRRQEGHWICGEEVRPRLSYCRTPPYLSSPRKMAPKMSQPLKNLKINTVWSLAVVPHRIFVCVREDICKTKPMGLTILQF